MNLLTTTPILKNSEDFQLFQAAWSTLSLVACGFALGTGLILNALEREAPLHTALGVVFVVIVMGLFIWPRRKVCEKIHGFWLVVAGWLFGFLLAFAMPPDGETSANPWISLGFLTLALFVYQAYKENAASDLWTDRALGWWYETLMWIGSLTLPVAFIFQAYPVLNFVAGSVVLFGLVGLWREAKRRKAQATIISE